MKYIFVFLQLIAFFEKYPEAGAGASARKRALEIIENNIQWISVNKKIIEDWIVNESL